MSVDQKQGKNGLFELNMTFYNTLNNVRPKKEGTQDKPVNNQSSYKDEDCQDGQNSTNHIVDMKSFSFNRWEKGEW